MRDATGLPEPFPPIAAAEQPAPRAKWCYVGAPAVFRLDVACHIINKALGGTCYMVGSALQRPDFRDVDVRCIMVDENFDALFGVLGESWEKSPLWMMLSISVSAWLREQTGLPVDFQVQRAAHANKKHAGDRHFLGLYVKGDPPAWRAAD